MADKRRTKTRAPGVYRSISGKYEIAYRDSDGRLRFQVVDGSFEDAKDARAAIVGKVRKGESVRPSKTTFADYAENWLSALNRKPRTLEAYRYQLNKHLLPRFGRRKLAEITTNDVARLVAEMQKAGYSGWTISGALTPLSALMRRAKRDGLIPANPVGELDRDERPKLDSGEKRVLTENEMGRLLAAAGGFRAIIAVGLFAGTRIGETLGLTWDDIDFEHGFIRVRFQLDRNRQRVPLKTAESRRDVVLTPQLARVLREHRMASRWKGDTDFVFPAPDGRGRDHRSTSRGIERAVERAQLGTGVSSHVFRHTFASMLIVGLKLDPVSVSRQIGHRNTTVTLNCYTHLFERAKAADAMRAQLEAGFGHLLLGAGGPV
jgi:integrase